MFDVNFLPGSPAKSSVKVKILRILINGGVELNHPSLKQGLCASDTVPRLKTPVSLIVLVGYFMVLLP